MTDENFLQKYEELLDKDYCNCNEMNCIDNNAPRRILNIAKDLKEKLEQKNKVIERARKRLGDFADEMASNGNAYAICIDVLDILKKGVDE